MYTSDVLKTRTYPMIRTVRVFSRRYIPFWGRVRVCCKNLTISCANQTSMSNLYSIVIWRGQEWFLDFFLAKKFEWTININFFILFHSIVGMVSKLQSKSSLNSIHCDVKYYFSILIMYTKTHNIWSTVNISIVIIIWLDICGVVLSICTKTPKSKFRNRSHYYLQYQLHPCQAIITWGISNDRHLLQTDMVTQCTFRMF